MWDSVTPIRFTFQSTLSVRRATNYSPAGGAVSQISIHALRKESDDNVTTVAFDNTISIHALRKESDPHQWHWTQD